MAYVALGKYLTLDIGEQGDCSKYSMYTSRIYGQEDEPGDMWFLKAVGEFTG